MSNVLIEFTQATEKRAKGERVYVDEVSATSFVKKKKHAKVITEAQLKAEARRAAAGQDADDVDDDDETGDEDTTDQASTTTAGGAS